MKKFYLLLVVLCISTKILSQTTATDFTVNDCDGNTHHLFSELNSGKVVVIAWVMPCPPCATHAISAYSSALNFETSHPNRVKYYLVDDFANTTCSALSSWASSNGLGSTTMFSEAAISMTDYGQIGMPKIVVLGGLNHQIYFNQNSSTQGIDAAIIQALQATNINDGISEIDIELFPNPSSDFLNISYNLTSHSDLTIEIFNMIGQSSMDIINIHNTYKGTYKLDVSNLPIGTYFLKCNSNNICKVTKFTIVR